MTSAPGTEQSRAVLIGTARYDHLQPIPAAAANIDDLAGLLTRPGGAFTVKQCATVADPDRDTLGTSVVKAAREAADILLVYYAGHGLIDRRGRLHLTVPGSDPDDIRWTTVPFETLREEILDSPARARVLILDCCFAGRAFEAMADVPGLIAGQTDLRGTYTITSSSANEPSFAPAGDRHTAFTGALLAAATALPGGTLDELYQETDQYLHRSGHPRPRRRNIDIAGQLQLFGRAERPPAAAEATGQTGATNNNPVDMLAERGEPAGGETLYRRAAEVDDTDAVQDRAIQLAERGEKAEAEAGYRRAAEAGNSNAMYNLAAMLSERGEKAEAEAWYRRAASAFHTNAMYNLAAMLSERGEKAEAETLYRRAASAFHTNAMNSLAAMLSERGQKAEAAIWYHRAAEAGHPDAMYTLAVLLSKRGEQAEAQTWNRRAAEAGHPDAMYTLAALLKNGGKEAEAETLYRRAAEAGHLDAMNSLAALLKKRGEKAEAAIWYHRVAEHRTLAK